ncbi:Pantoate-beta-alanine ligase [Calocera cornea HHB12733]|uniref:Pantoate--beta-alanine ligase n=1 Tax=Calocera cornea HHB12733 TaxID=1353952 RepID=A0A165JIF4_9BASI|nr:Pantoate-beta-alanine ligase [Calocera cornea HHB12733]
MRIPTRQLAPTHPARRALSTSPARRIRPPPPAPIAEDELERARRATSIPILTSLAEMRQFRDHARTHRHRLGLVPTMGALHAGHAALVTQCLADNDATVVSIFVNPAQFAPHEDLATYPRTLPADATLLHTLAAAHRTVDAIFLPSVQDMYPSGLAQHPADQRGTFVEVAGYSHLLEGRTRPTFLRGVATVVTKLFNAVQPDRAYFGQKDIQQALLMRRLATDLLCPHPLPHNVRIVPTVRAPDGLALSSRNAYLSPAERAFAPALYTALHAAQTRWRAHAGRTATLATATHLVSSAAQRALEHGVTLKLDYVELSDPETLEPVPEHSGPPRETTLSAPGSARGTAAVLSGAMWVGSTRLIDNLVLGDERAIVY